LGVDFTGVASIGFGVFISTGFGATDGAGLSDAFGEGVCGGFSKGIFGGAGSSDNAGLVEPIVKARLRRNTKGVKRPINVCLARSVTAVLHTV
jgi:hypothetical protein